MKKLAYAGWALLGLLILAAGVPLANQYIGMPNTTAMKLYPSTAAYLGVVRRVTDGVAGALPVDYVPSAIIPNTSPCSLNSGAGDGGSQIPTSDGNCWLARFPTAGIGAAEWGAVGNGVVDDTVAMQAAINITAAAGIPLLFNTSKLYKITSTLNITTPAKLVGPYRYGVWTTNAAGTSSSCPWGLMTPNTGITMLNVSAVTATIQGLCIDMTGSNNTSATAGTAIQFAPPSATTYQTGFQVEQNTIVGPYKGITINGFGYSAGCCGEGTSADGNAVLRNTIVNPAAVGIQVGLNTAGSATPGNTLTDNAIVCKNTVSQASGIGIEILDGAIWYDGTQNGPEACDVGIKIDPGTVSGHGQSAEFNGDGVFGDQSRLHDLWIAPQTGGTIWPVTIGGKGPWTGATSNVNSVLIDCTASGGGCFEFSIIGGIFHGGTGQNGPVINVLGGASGPFDLTINGASVCQSGTPAAGAGGINLNAGSGNTGRWIITNNRIGTGCAGTAMATGIALTINAGSTSGGSVTIANNDLSSITATPISYAPSSTDLVLIHDNMGIDDVTPSVTVTGLSALTLPATFQPVIGLTGTGTPTFTSLAHITAYGNRQIELVNNMTGGGTLTFTAGTGICNSTTLPGNSMLIGRWNTAGACYNLR